MLNVLIISYLSLVVISSFVAFFCYGWDKRQARLDRWRIPEQRLHLMSMIGGWPGAILGQKYFRHKTQKWIFKLMTSLSVLLHLGIVVFLVWIWQNYG